MAKKTAANILDSYAATMRQQVVRSKPYTLLENAKQVLQLDVTAYVVDLAATCHRLYQQLEKHGYKVDKPMEFSNANGEVWCIPYKTYEVFALTSSKECFLLLLHPDILNHHAISVYRFYHPVDAAAQARYFRDVDTILASCTHIQDYYSDESFVAHPQRPTLDRVWQDFLGDEHETSIRSYPAVVQYQLGVKDVRQLYTQDLETLFLLIEALDDELRD